MVFEVRCFELSVWLNNQNSSSLNLNFHWSFPFNEPGILLPGILRGRLEEYYQIFSSEVKNFRYLSSISSYISSSKIHIAFPVQRTMDYPQSFLTFFLPTKKSLKMQTSQVYFIHIVHQIYIKSFLCTSFEMKLKLKTCF